MKNTLVKLSVACTVFIFFATPLWASGSVSIPVSCSIPAIPGLNAPLNDATATQAVTKETLPQEGIQVQEETTLPAAEMLQEIEERTLLVSAESESETVRTVYSR